MSRRIEGARKIQERLRRSLCLEPLEEKSIRTVCGVDVSYLDDRDTIFATAVVLSYPGLDVMEERFRVAKTEFPYVPGYLAFREVPAIVMALQLLTVPVDVFLVDGHGTAHPRQFGIASHLGVITGLPAVGCAKKKLVGEYDDPPVLKGSYTYLYIRGEKVGAAVRTREGKNPVFVSPGHLTDIESAVRFTLSVTGKFRIPVPLRCAHGLTVRVRREWKERETPRR